MKSARAKKLVAVLREQGHTNIRVRWEPLGPALEMCGRSGGWFFKSDQQHGVNPLGSCIEMAIDSVRMYVPKVTR